MIRAGDLDTRIMIQQRSTSQDASGARVDTWTTFAKRWAAIERTPGSEVWASAQRSGRVPTVFRLRKLTGVLPAMRVSRASKLYDIKSVVEPTARCSDMLLVTDLLVEAV